VLRNAPFGSTLVKGTEDGYLVVRAMAGICLFIWLSTYPDHPAAGAWGSRLVHAAAAQLLAHYAEAADPDYGKPAEPRETYRQEYIRCNKERCKRCADGHGHGP